MCELAFGSNGERFEVPSSAAFWRVRRLRPGGRGVPEVVFAESGLPLVVPIELGIEEFRGLVEEVHGKYRLDAIDDAHQVVDGCGPAYVCIAERKARPVVTYSKEERSGGSEDLLRELVRTNAEMVRTMTERFAGVMESAAVLLRAADGAGLPQREPAVVPVAPVVAPRNVAVVDEPEEDGGEPPDGGARIAEILQGVAEQTMPIIGHALNTRVLGLTTEQSIALMGGSPPVSSEPAVSVETDTPAEPEEETAVPRTPADFMAHLLAIEKLLTKREAQLARYAVQQMPPDAMARWREQIGLLSPEQAAEMVRAEVARLSAASGSAATSAKKEAA